MKRATLDAVTGKLGLDRPAPDLDGLRAIYAAWCKSVPFDNVLKLAHLADGRSWPLPGATAESFFATWLEHGTGGTCWAGNGALHDLLAALGFDVTRAIATMLPSPDVVGPNHGSVVVALDGERWIVDASILGGEPIRLPAAGERTGAGSLPRFEWLEGAPAVRWRTPAAPGGFPCRFDRLGATREEWDELHRRTTGWSPFNFELNVRVLRGRTGLGLSSGRRFALAEDGSLAASVLDGAARTRFLVDEIGISEEMARRVPDDRPVPPRPEGH